MSVGTIQVVALNAASFECQINLLNEEMRCEMAFYNLSSVVPLGTMLLQTGPNPQRATRITYNLVSNRVVLPTYDNPKTSSWNINVEWNATVGCAANNILATLVNKQ